MSPVPFAPRFRVAVVGGGAAGTLLALHLCATEGVEVTLFDRHAAFGRGVAYSAQAPWHCLNVPAMKMGGWHEGDTLGFARWLHHSLGVPLEECEHHFAERSVYGDWLCSLLQPLVAAGRARTVAREVVDIEPADEPADKGGVLVLDDGARHCADAIVLCHGNSATRRLGLVPESVRYIDEVWSPQALARIAPDDSALVVGTGSSGLDAVLDLLHRGHRGPVTLLSRRGLLPRDEAVGEPHPDFLPRQRRQSLRGTVAQVRRELRKAHAAGLPWQCVMDALVKRAEEVWAGFSRHERRQFVQHVRPYWMAFRHRADPRVLERIDAARAAGQLQVVAGRLLSAETHEDGYSVAVRKRDGSNLQIDAGWVLNAAGPQEETARQTDALTVHLLRRGLARAGSQGLGWAVLEDGEVQGPLQGEGVLFALGLPTRGTFWDVTSVPAIRARIAPLVERLLQRLTDTEDQRAPGMLTSR